MKPPVLTRSYNNSRTGVNDQESVLTPDAVGTRGIAKLFSLPVPDDPRGVEAQPLIVPDLRLANGSVHDVVFLCSMGNHVYAYDAGNGKLLWGPISLGPPVKNNPRPIHQINIDSKNINEQWGVISTPVIDSQSQTMYVIRWTSADPNPVTSLAASQYHLFAINITDGAFRHQPLPIQASFTTKSGQKLNFTANLQKQRAALLLESVKDAKGVAHRTLFMACGGVAEDHPDIHGWLLAFDLDAFRLEATFVTTQEGHEGGGGIWQAAQGPCGDGQGNIYFMTGNGTWNGVTDFAESFIKLHYTPPSDGQKASLRIVDWFTPISDEGAVVGGVRFPGRVTGNTNDRGTWDDQDLGSGGPIILSDLKLVIGAGKDGIVYCLDQHNFGKTSAADLAKPAQNYAKLKSPPIFFTYFPGFQVSPAPNHPQDLNQLFLDGKTHHLHGSPVYWHSPDRGPMVFCWGENESLRAWNIDAQGKITFLAIGHEVASAGMTGRGGMPGGMITLSCNGTARHSGIVWTLAPLNDDANQRVVQGVLRAYDATQFDTDGQGNNFLRLLWHSDQWNIFFFHNKFNLPIVFNGKVYVPTYGGTVDVYGLTPH
jgi:outer membrane protein assembly factor BamB